MVFSFHANNSRKSLFYNEITSIVIAKITQVCQKNNDPPFIAQKPKPKSSPPCGFPMLPAPHSRAGKASLILFTKIWPPFFSFSLVAYVLDRNSSTAGPVMGTYIAISDLGISLGPIVMGMVIHLSSYAAMFLGLAFTGVINLIYFYWSCGNPRAFKRGG